MAQDTSNPSMNNTTSIPRIELILVKNQRGACVGQSTAMRVWQCLSQHPVVQSMAQVMKWQCGRPIYTYYNYNAVDPVLADQPD